MRVRWAALLLVLAGCLCLPPDSHADDVGRTGTAAVSPATLQEIVNRGVLRCGSVERPGIATMNGAGGWSGLAVEVCRAVSVAIFGEHARFTYHHYASTRDFDLLRAGKDDIAFLTFAEMAEQKLTDTLLPGPPIFVESVDMMVAEQSTALRPGDLAGRGICFMIATVGELSLEAWFHDHHLEFVPHAFQEDGELLDTYNVQRCQAVVGESTHLAAQRRDVGVNKLKSRLLADHLDSYPLIATTPLQAGAQLAAVTAWTVGTLINADARETDHHANGLAAMGVDGERLGLRRDWQKVVVETVGSYSRIFARTMGADSPLRLEQGLNRRLADGGVLVVPTH